MNEHTLGELLAAHQARTEQALERWLPQADIAPQRLHQAMRYAVLDGGKRVRPFLVYSAGQALDVPAAQLDAPACAVELIHAYSLIHDDLPAMDDDALRRGKPTCHRAFDEATAILAGDAIQALAFHVLAHDEALHVDAQRRLQMIDRLALASGSRGMAGGQAIDLEAVGKHLDLPALELMHIHKTGALIRASVMLGALSSAAVSEAQLKQLDHYAKCIGLAFQIQDDILDVEGDTTTLGKTRGADLALDKPTYPALLGLDGAKQRAAELYHEALTSLAEFGPAAEPLRWMARYIISRSS
ncbi:geranyl transferase [Candidatus Tenderia electrophaga]|jgi:farnesyl diphosphate synthase|uniref:Geranyl transferase n=1 Tax=Candidatus Tenderia electrophaga TaxID=1748243 RepID=A0A0S2T9R6_9GAMM|nr:geranyl transferase [Candidatus Tenderia electrophaga]